MQTDLPIMILMLILMRLLWWLYSSQQADGDYKGRRSCWQQLIYPPSTR